MDRFCFVHAADLHLDTPFENIERVPPPIADALRDASLNAWEALVQLTIARGAACLLLAGDLYDGVERGVRAQARFRSGLERLVERGIQVFIVLGNHDPLEDWLAMRDWPVGVTVFDAAAVACVPLVCDGAQLASVHGISYSHRDCRDNLALRFKRGTGPGLHIGLLHCNVGANTDHPVSSPCTVEDLRGAGMDYWALGHIHRRAYVAAGDPWIVYPGDLQGRSPAAKEQGPKGAVVVEVESDAVREVTFEALDQVRFVSVDLEVSGQHDLDVVRGELITCVERLRRENPGRGLLVQGTLRGQADVHRVLRRSGGGRGMLRELREQAAHWHPFVWWTAIRDQTQVAIDRSAIRQRDDLLAGLLRRREALANDPGGCVRFLDQQFEPLLRKWVAEIEPGEVAGLLGDAEDLALDLLMNKSTT